MKPAKSTNIEDDNDEEDSCTECCWLFQHLEVMLSPHVEAIIAEQKESHYRSSKSSTSYAILNATRTM
jgi:hypothetical protein